MDDNALKKLLAGRLSKERYTHSLAVADEAVRLAEKYGGDREKVYLCGLLHDITKNDTVEEHLTIFRGFGIILNNIEQNAFKLWHAISGAVYVKNFLHIEDEEIINAIRYHTTGKAGMSLTAKILFLADFTSSDRDYEDVDVIRALVDESLEDAFIYALQFSVTDLVRRKQAVHPDTLNAYNEAVTEKRI